MSQRPRRPAPPPPNSGSHRPKLRNQLLFALGIIMLALGAFYTALVVATQIDQIFFPDSQLHIGGPLSKIPGVDAGDKAEGEAGPGGRINILVMGLDRRANELAENS